MPINLPYPVSGTVVDSDSAALASIKVTLRNERTNETLTQNTNSSGQYSLNCGNLASGYAEADTITVFVIYTNYEDYEEHVIDMDSGGATVNLTLAAVPASDALKYFTVQEFYDFFRLTSGDDGVPLTNQVVAIGTMIETEIDRTCQSEFSVNTNTITQEYHDVVSSYQVDYFLDKKPVVSITTLQVNTAQDGAAPSWITLTEAAYQFELDLNTGRIRLTGTVGDATTPVYPEPGVRNLRATYTYGRSTVPADIRKLAILMTARDFQQGSVSRALFRGQDSFKTDHYNVFNKQIDTILSWYRKVDMVNV